MSAPVEPPYVVPPDASDHCRDLVVKIMVAVGKPSHDEAELQDRLVAMVAALGAEIARSGDADLAIARYKAAGEILSQIGPRCIDRAQRIRGTDRSKN
jgi:hypothetical protein